MFHVLRPVSGITSLPHHLLICGERCVSDGGVYIRDAGVTHIFNCSANLRYWVPPSSISMRTEMVVDRDEFSLANLWTHGLAWLYQVFSNPQNKVLLICSDGLRVCPVIIIAYRMLYQQERFRTASARVAMDINDGFYRQLLELDALLSGPHGAVNRLQFLPAPKEPPSSPDMHNRGGKRAEAPKKRTLPQNVPLITSKPKPSKTAPGNRQAGPGPPPRADLILAKRDVKLSDLIERGYIQVGAEIVYKQRRNIVHVGSIINRFGMISYDDQQYDSPSLFVTNLLHKNGGSQRTKRNGWTAANVYGRTLDSLREELLAAQHATPDFMEI